MTGSPRQVPLLETSNADTGDERRKLILLSSFQASCLDRNAYGCTCPLVGALYQHGLMRVFLLPCPEVTEQFLAHHAEVAAISRCCQQLQQLIACRCMQVQQMRQNIESIPDGVHGVRKVGPKVYSAQHLLNFDHIDSCPQILVPSPFSMHCRRAGVQGWSYKRGS